MPQPGLEANAGKVPLRIGERVAYEKICEASTFGHSEQRLGEF